MHLFVLFQILQYEEDMEEGEAALKTKKAGRKRTSKKSIYEVSFSAVYEKIFDFKML